MKKRSVILILLCLTGAVLMAFGLKTAKEEWQTGVALYSFNQHPFPEAIAMADSTGTKLVEGFSFYKLGPAFNNLTMADLSPSDVERMKKMLAAKGLSMPSMYFSGGKNLAEWKKYFDLGREFGLKCIVCEPQKKQLGMIDSLAGIYKIKIAIHEHEKPDIYCDPDSLLKFIKGYKNIGACADIGHWVRSGFDAVKSLEKLRSHIVELHIHDNDKANKDVDLGTGTIDFATLTKELKQQHFTGILFYECEHDMKHNTQNVKRGMEYMQANVK